MKIIIYAPRNEDVCIVDVMHLVQSRVDLPSTFGGEANMTLPRLVRRVNHVDFTCGPYKYSTFYDITRQDHGLIYGEVNASGPKHGILNILLKL